MIFECSVCKWCSKIRLKNRIDLRDLRNIKDASNGLIPTTLSLRMPAEWPHALSGHGGTVLAIGQGVGSSSSPGGNHGGSHERMEVRVRLV